MIVYVLPCEFMFIRRRKVSSISPYFENSKKQFFDSIFRLPWRIVAEISFNCRTNAAKYRSKVRRYFEENKAKFILITFAQYCSRLLARQFACNLFQNCRFSESLETRLSSREKRDETGNLLLSGTVTQTDFLLT